MEEQVKKKRGASKLLITLVGAVVLVLGTAIVVGGGVFVWKNKQLDDVQSDYTEIEDKYTALVDASKDVSDKCDLDKLCPECEVSTECVEYEECMYSEDLVLPQIYFLGKAYYTQADLDDLQEKVIDPIVAYYDGFGMTVVSIDIDNDNRGGAVKNEFTISVIISKNDGTNEPLYTGFLLTKVGGELPYWAPISAD